MIGQFVSHYKILEKLGGGGMGVVYKAEDTKLKRTVALKFLPPELTRDEEAKQRFIHEAQAASALQHDNICTIHDIDEAPEGPQGAGQMFICMDFYEGETLKEKIEQRPLPIDQAIGLAMQVARGLAKAHEAGMVHRDLKPANLLVTKAGEAKIVDFGLAKLAGQTRLTRAGSTLGTAAYMSPEQARGEAVDHRSDIWSLGVVMYEMITGGTPFNADYENALIYSILNTEPKPLAELRSGVPKELERIVQKVLAKDPRERYQHVDDVVADLRRLKGESEGVARAHAVPSSVRPRRTPFRRAAVVAAMLGLAAISYFVMKPLLEDQMLASNPIPVAVITFENQTGDRAYDYLQEAIPNLLITNLEQSHFLRVTTWERLRDLMKQMGKENEKTIMSELGIELCRRGDINVIVIGRYTKAGEMFATDVKVLDVDTKELLKSANSKGRGVESILESQIDDLSREIAQGAGLSERRVEKATLNVASVTTNSMDAYNYYLRGRQNYHQFYYQDAKKFLGKAIALDSSFAEAHVFLALTLKTLNEGGASDSAFRKAMLYAPRANERNRLKIESAYAANIERDRAKSIRLLQKVVTKYPEEKDAHMFLGILYRNDGAYELAMMEQKKALELDPQYAAALNELGYVYSTLGQYNKAIECFQRQISVLPGDANPMDSMAELYFIMGNLDDAIARYREVLEIKPDFYSSYLALAYTLTLRGDLEEGRRSVDRYIAAVPSAGLKAEGHWDRALFDLALGQYRDAFADLQKTRSFASAAGDQVWRARAGQLEGWVLFELKDYAQSRTAMEQWFEYSMAWFPSIAPGLAIQRECTLGLLDLRQERLSSARARLPVIDSLMPLAAARGRRQLQYDRDILYAEVLIAEDSTAKAVQICNETGYLPTPTFSSPEMVRFNIPIDRDTRARAYLKLGERDKAIADYERLVKFDSAVGDHRIPWPKYRIDLARLYVEIGEHARAREQYERFLETWKNADRGRPEIAEARKRLKSLE